MGDFVYLKKSRYCLPPGRNLLKAADYTAMVAANRMIEDAEERARHIIARAERVYVSEKERGYEDGVAEGKRSLAGQVLETVLRTVDFLGSVETQIVETVMRALHKILAEKEPKQLICGVVKNVLKVARGQKQVSLRVAPSQVEMVREEMDRILAHFPTIHFIDVLADSRLNTGGCILESEVGVVDAGLEVQLRAIEVALRKNFERGIAAQPL